MFDGRFGWGDESPTFPVSVARCVIDGGSSETLVDGVGFLVAQLPADDSVFVEDDSVLLVEGWDGRRGKGDHGADEDDLVFSYEAWISCSLRDMCKDSSA